MGTAASVVLVKFQGAMGLCGWQDRGRTPPLLLPNPPHVRAKADPTQGLACTSEPQTGLLDAAPKHPTKRILKTNISCKQDINFCQKDKKKKKGLRFFLAASAPPASPSSLVICSLQSEAGRDGSRGDPGLREGQQQAQGPQRRLAPGPPAGDGLPRAHRVSTARARASPGPTPLGSRPAAELPAAGALTSCGSRAPCRARCGHEISPTPAFHKRRGLCLLQTNPACWLRGDPETSEHGKPGVTAGPLCLGVWKSWGLVELSL